MKPAPPAAPTAPPAPLTDKQRAIADRLRALQADYALLTDGDHYITVPVTTYEAHKQGYTDIGYIAITFNQP